jgi:hypothetical protein
MKISEAIENDLSQITQLFYETVNSVNQKDFSKEQIAVWSASSQKVE